MLCNCNLIQNNSNKLNEISVNTEMNIFVEFIPSQMYIENIYIPVLQLT